MESTVVFVVAVSVLRVLGMLWKYALGAEREREREREREGRGRERERGEREREGGREGRKEGGRTQMSSR
jgi:hypothetical protein